jgi:hypothetical protein
LIRFTTSYTKRKQHLQNNGRKRRNFDPKIVNEKEDFEQDYNIKLNTPR